MLSPLCVTSRIAPGIRDPQEDRPASSWSYGMVVTVAIPPAAPAAGTTGHGDRLGLDCGFSAPRVCVFASTFSRPSDPIGLGSCLDDGAVEGERLAVGGAEPG